MNKVQLEPDYPALFEATLAKLPEFQHREGLRVAKHDPVIRRIAPGERAVKQTKVIGFKVGTSQQPELYLSKARTPHLPHSGILLELVQYNYQATSSFPTRGFIDVTESGKRILIAEVEDHQYIPEMNSLALSSFMETFSSLSERYRLDYIATESAFIRIDGGHLQVIDAQTIVQESLKHRLLVDHVERLAALKNLTPHQAQRLLLLLKLNARDGIDRLPIMDL